MATGDTLLIFTPAAHEPPASDFAILDLRGDHLLLDFDASTNQHAVFPGVMPQRYANSGVSLRIHFAFSTAITGDVDWLAAFERVHAAGADLDTANFAAAQAAINQPVPDTSGQLAVATINFTNAQIAGIQPGDGFRLRITRDAASDTALGDAELRFVELREA